MPVSKQQLLEHFARMFYPFVGVSADNMAVAGDYDGRDEQTEGTESEVLLREQVDVSPFDELVDNLAHVMEAPVRFESERAR